MLPPSTENSAYSSNGNSSTTINGNGHRGRALVPSRFGLPPGPLGGWPPGMPGPTKPGGEGMNMQALLHAFRRRSVVAIALGFVCALSVAWAVWFFVPVQYEVETWFQLRAETPILVEAPAGESNRRGGPAEFDVFRRKQQAMITSPMVLLAALRNREISELPLIKEQDDPVLFLQDKLRVLFPGESELMRIAMRGEDPAQLVAIVNAVRDAYYREVVLRDNAERLEKKRTLEREAERVDDRIRSIRRRLDQVAEQLNLTREEHMELQQTLGMHRHSTLLAELREMTKKRDELESQRELLEFSIERAEKYNLPDLAIDNEVYKDPEISQLKAEEMQLDARLRSARGRFARNENGAVDNLYVRQLEEQLATVRETLQAYVANRRAELQGQLDSGAGAVEEYRAQLEMTNNNLARITQSIDQTKQDLEEIGKSLRSMSQMAPELAELNSQLQPLLISASKIKQELETLEIELKAPPRIERFDPAVPPDSNDIKMKIIIASFAALLSFGLTIFGISYWEMQAGRISTVSDVADSLGMRIVGGLPSLGKRLMRKGFQDDVVEAVDSLRTRLMHDASADGTRVVMVTSAGRKEGKTTLATQLAASLARAGRRVLLIDGDLRSPTNHLLFELPLDPGFCDVLRGEAELEDVIRPTRAGGLWLIPAGRCDIECLQELAKGVAAPLLDKLRLEFDFIILDSGPVLSIADSLLLGQCSDVTILSVLRDVSQASKIQEAYERLESVGATVLGTVVQGMKQHTRERAKALPLQVSRN